MLRDNISYICYVLECKVGTMFHSTEYKNLTQTKAPHRLDPKLLHVGRDSCGICRLAALKKRVLFKDIQCSRDLAPRRLVGLTLFMTGKEHGGSIGAPILALRNSDARPPFSGFISCEDAKVIRQSFLLHPASLMGGGGVIAYNIRT